jgi:hypothetical protein
LEGHMVGIDSERVFSLQALYPLGSIAGLF